MGKQIRSSSLSSLYAGNSTAVFMRAVMGAKSANILVLVSGFAEPFIYLLSVGFGLGHLVGRIEISDFQTVGYAQYVAPGLLAVSAVSGAIHDSTKGVFFRIHFGRQFEAMLSTSLGPVDVALGELLFALMRGFLQSLAFIAAMWCLGLTGSWLSLLALPALLLISMSFASIGMAITSYMKNFQQMDWISLVMLPMFMLSGVFFPINQYPDFAQAVVSALPLWHAVELVRMFTTGNLSGWDVFTHVLYFLGFLIVGFYITVSRLRQLFLR
ncbi:ABC transporter permease [Paenarthrobacter sp. NPDC089989]|uniref:ABC transporter permease n=1 Tax=unclassified Paenarthrobacter TaxID=2634190 RepID=UPI0038141AA7